MAWTSTVWTHCHGSWQWIVPATNIQQSTLGSQLSWHKVTMSYNNNHWHIIVVATESDVEPDGWNQCTTLPHEKQQLLYICHIVTITVIRVGYLFHQLVAQCATCLWQSIVKNHTGIDNVIDAAVDGVVITIPAVRAMYSQRLYYFPPYYSVEGVAQHDYWSNWYDRTNSC